MSFYTTSCERFLSRPFPTARDKSEFEMPLERWASYCQSAERASHAHPSSIKVLDLKTIIADAIKTLSVKTSTSRKEIALSNVHVEAAKVDAVVNAANETLLGGGGVDFAIHEGAGINLVRECATLGGCQVGEAKVTKGYELPATYVIHTVAPILDAQEMPQVKLLERCYLESLRAAERMGLESIVFPCLGCGFYGFPVELSARTAISAVKRYLEESSGSVKTVIFSLFDEEQRNLYKKELESYLPL